VLQPAFLDGLFLDLLSHLQDLRAATVVDVGGRQVVQALVVTMVVVVIDEGTDLVFQVPGQEVVFQQHAVLHGLVPALDLALGLRVMRGATDVIDALVLEIVGQVGRDVGRAVVAEQPWLVQNRRLIASRSLQRQSQCAADVLGPHRAAQLPGDDVARVIVEHGRQVEQPHLMILK